MAYLPTALNEEEQRQQQLLAGSAPAGGVAAGGVGTPGASAPSSGGGFVPIAAYFGANPDASSAMADRLAGGLEERARDIAGGGTDVGAAQAIIPEFAAAATGPGRATMIGAEAGPGYTPGMGGLDSYLAGAAAPGRFEQLRDYWTPGLNQVGLPTPPDTREVPYVPPAVVPDPIYDVPGGPKSEDLETQGAPITGATQASPLTSKKDDPWERMLSTWRGGR